MTVTVRGPDAACIERRGNATQARYAGRPQLGDDGGHLGSARSCASDAGSRCGLMSAGRQAVVRGMTGLSLSRLCSALDIKCIKKSPTDSPLPFPNQIHQLADFLVREVDEFVIPREHRQHHMALPLGKLDRPPQCSHPHEHRFAPELSRRADQVGSIGWTDCPNGCSRTCNNR
jgi:hypothetical protein